VIIQCLWLDCILLFRKDPEFISAMKHEHQHQVLAVSQRPQTLDDLVGQEHLVRMIKTQWSSGRIPHFFLLSGAIGCGKTTIARILARMLHSDPLSTDYSQSEMICAHRKNVLEINAADKTGIDHVRQLLENMHYKPHFPGKVRIVIMDEAHQMSQAAQNALLTETEDSPPHAVFIFCTSQVNKIIPALRRRAYIITPRCFSSRSDKKEFVYAYLKKIGKSQKDTDAYAVAYANEFIEQLHHQDVTSPGIILQAMEKWLSGLEPFVAIISCDAVAGSGGMTGSQIDALYVCRALAKGDWCSCARALQHMTKTDVYFVRNCVLGYLKTMLFQISQKENTAQKQVNVAKAIRQVTQNMNNYGETDEAVLVPVFLANLCMACYSLN